MVSGGEPFGLGCTRPALRRPLRRIPGPDESRLGSQVELSAPAACTRVAQDSPVLRMLSAGTVRPATGSNCSDLRGRDRQHSFPVSMVPQWWRGGRAGRPLSSRFRTMGWISIGCFVACEVQSIREFRNFLEVPVRCSIMVPPSQRAMHDCNYSRQHLHSVSKRAQLGSRVHGEQRAISRRIAYRSRCGDRRPGRPGARSRRAASLRRSA